MPLPLAIGDGSLSDLFAAVAAVFGSSIATVTATVAIYTFVRTAKLERRRGEAEIRHLAARDNLTIAVEDTTEAGERFVIHVSSDEADDLLRLVRDLRALQQRHPTLSDEVVRKVLQIVVDPQAREAHVDG